MSEQITVKYVINEMLDMSIIPNKYVAHWDETKYVTMSSFVFLVPSMYSYCNEIYTHAIILFLASIISANFWRDASYSYRRILDRIISKIAFILLFKDALIYVRHVPRVMIVFNIFVAFMSCYYYSNKYCGKSPVWWKYHVSFHLLATVEQLIIINSMIDYNHSLYNHSLYNHSLYNHSLYNHSLYNHSLYNDCKQYKIE